MEKLITLPHKMHESTCYVNGLFDILTWKRARYDYFLLPIIGGMAGFAYLKFKLANPPCMVYWGNSPKYLLKEIGEIIGVIQTISEGKSFKNEFPKMKRLLDIDKPVMVGALDMYYLHYYPELYKKEHVPIHYVLLVGYDDKKEVVYIYDCSFEEVQEVRYDEFEASLNVNVPGMSKKNTYRTFTLPDKIPSELEVATKGLANKAKCMLKPPVSMSGIPAMRKLAKEIVSWSNDDCYRHMVAYAGLTPPLIPEDLSHSDGLRFEQARVLTKLSEKYDKKEWNSASALFNESGKLIIELCKKALTYNGEDCSLLIKRTADIEEEAHQLLM